MEKEIVDMAFNLAHELLKVYATEHPLHHTDFYRFDEDEGKVNVHSIHEDNDE